MIAVVQGPRAPEVLPETHLMGRMGLVVPERDGQAVYTRRQLDFFSLHREEYLSAWMNPGQASRAILERLAYELFHLKHSRPACMCRCSHRACRVWREQVGGHGTVRAGQLDDVAREIGRTSPVNPPMPSVDLLDFGRVPRGLRSRSEQVQFLNGRLAA